jgi:MtN3 and saliva related transmembrane protein
MKSSSCKPACGNGFRRPPEGQERAVRVFADGPPVAAVRECVRPAFDGGRCRRSGHSGAFLGGSGNLVFSVAFSPDGHTLASGSDDGIARLWNLKLDYAIERICVTAEASRPAVARLHPPTAVSATLRWLALWACMPREACGRGGLAAGAAVACPWSCLRPSPGNWRTRSRQPGRLTRGDAMAPTVLEVAASSWAVLMGIAPLLQIRRMVRERSSRDVSVAYFAILLVGFALWIAYGAAAGIVALVIPNSVALCIGAAVVIVALLLRRHVSGGSRNRVPPPQARRSRNGAPTRLPDPRCRHRST